MNNVEMNKGLLKNSKIMLWIAIIVPLATLITTVWLSLYQYEKLNRPYLTFDLSETQFIAVSKDMNFFKLEATLNNIGNLPARFRLSEIQNSGYQKVFWENQDLYGNNKFTDGVIFPNQKIKLMWFARWNNASDDYAKWIKTGDGASIGFFPVNDIFVPIEYCMINDKSDCKNEYATNMVGSLARTEDGLLGISQFIWKIDDSLTK